MAENIIPVGNILGEGGSIRSRSIQALNAARDACLGCVNFDDCRPTSNITRDRLFIRTRGELAQDREKCAQLIMFSQDHSQEIHETFEELSDKPIEDQIDILKRFFGAIFGDRDESQETKKKRRPRRSGE